MTRLEKFTINSKCVINGKLYKKLSATELKMCVNFIAEHDHLDRDKYAEKANRWMIDQPKPKNYSTMWAIVLQANLNKEKI